MEWKHRWGGMVEFYEILSLVFVVGIFTLIGVRWFIVSKNYENNVKKREISPTTEKINAYKETLTLYKTENKSMQGKLNRLKGQKDRSNDQEYEEEEEPDIPLPILKQAAQQMGLKAEALDDPSVLEWIQVQARDPSIKKLILQYAKSKVSNSGSEDPYNTPDAV